MFKNLTTIAVWLVAGPNAAAKTHKIVNQIQKSRKSRGTTYRPSEDGELLKRIQIRLDVLAAR